MRMFVLLIGVSVFADDNGIWPLGDEPIAYLSSCQADFNGDQKIDIALLFETDLGREAVVLMRTTEGYNAILLNDSLPANMFMSCGTGSRVRGTTEDGQQVEVETPGAYIVLYQPESAAMAYYWDGTEFNYVWISD